MTPRNVQSMLGIAAMLARLGFLLILLACCMIQRALASVSVNVPEGNAMRRTKLLQIGDRRRRARNGQSVILNAAGIPIKFGPFPERQHGSFEVVDVRDAPAGELVNLGLPENIFVRPR